MIICVFHGLGYCNESDLFFGDGLEEKSDDLRAVIILRTGHLNEMVPGLSIEKRCVLPGESYRQNRTAVGHFCAAKPVGLIDLHLQVKVLP